MYQLPMVAFFGVLSDTQACNGGREKSEGRRTASFFFPIPVVKVAFFLKKNATMTIE